MKKEEDFDYGHGITQKDVDRYNNRPKYLHNEKIRPDGQSLSEWLTEYPFMDGYSEDEKKEFIDTVKAAAGFYDDEEESN